MIKWKLSNAYTKKLSKCAHKVDTPKKQALATGDTIEAGKTAGIKTPKKVRLTLGEKNKKMLFRVNFDVVEQMNIATNKIPALADAAGKFKFEKARRIGSLTIGGPPKQVDEQKK